MKSLIVCLMFALFAVAACNDPIAAGSLESALEGAERLPPGPPYEVPPLQPREGWGASSVDELIEKGKYIAETEGNLDNNNGGWDCFTSFDPFTDDVQTTCCITDSVTRCCIDIVHRTGQIKGSCWSCGSSGCNP